MKQGLQKLNVDQRLAVWTQRISDCRSNGVSIKHWCQDNGISKKTYYYWQRRIYKIAQEQQRRSLLNCIASRPFLLSQLRLRSSALLCRYMPEQMKQHCLVVSRVVIMLNDFTGIAHVYIACGYTDIRKGIAGFILLVQ